MKTAIVTGASRGIGSEIAFEFAKNNYNVVINYNNSESEAIKLKEKIDSYICNNSMENRAIICKADVANRQQVATMIEVALGEFKNIDVLVNNAGIAQIKLFSDISQDEWNRMIATHLNGAFNLCQEVMPNMIHNKSGSIINISSMWGQVGASCEVHYSTVKAGLIGFTKALAKELALSNIRVNCICPGLIETQMNSNSLSKEVLDEFVEDIPLQRIGKPKDIANMVVFLSSENASYVTGQVIGVNGGYII